MTELHKKNLLLKRDYIEEKIAELKLELKEATKAPNTIAELDDIEFFITTNGLKKYA